MIMRYQSISPDSLSLTNGRRANQISKEDDEERGEINGNWTIKKGLSRFRSQEQQHHIGNGTEKHQNLESGGGGGDFLQWGQRKRSRWSRGMMMGLTTDDNTSTSKIQRRSSLPNPSSSSSSPNVNLMPPPPSINGNGIAKEGTPIIKSQSRTLSSTPSPVRRNSEERSGGGGGSGSGGNKSPPPSNSSRGISSRSRVGKKSTFLDKKNNPYSSSNRDEKMNGCLLLLQQHQQNQGVVGPSDVLNNIVSPPQQGGCSSTIDDDNNAAARPPKLGGGGEVNEWPRIYIPLSRKEKEEDFLAMKGTKLPHRPKKRPKAVERTLQYCFPGMWLSDLPRGRYDVREKKEKCPKKQKRRGLKGMESMESGDSE